MTAKVSDVEGTALVRQLFTEARRTEQIPWMFGQCMVRQELEERAFEGLKAIAQLWFLEFDDETRLPRELMDLMTDVLDLWHLVDVTDFLEDDEEDGDDAPLA